MYKNVIKVLQQFVIFSLKKKGCKNKTKTKSYPIAEKIY